MKWFFALLFCVNLTATARADEFANLDGRIYNGKFYPNVETIEWGDDPETYMVYHIHWKGHKVQLSFKVETVDSNVRMWVHYYIQERNEHLCRRSLAPGWFKENAELYVYSNNTDKDEDDVLVSQKPLAAADGQQRIYPSKYVDCPDSQQNSSESTTDESKPDAKPTPSPDSAAAAVSAAAPQPLQPLAPDAADTTIKSKNGGAEFSDW